MPLLRCIECLKSDWDLESESEDGFEIRTATIRCRSCGRVYPVAGGIVDVLGTLPEEVAAEKKHAESMGYLITQDGEKYPINPETVRQFQGLFLSLPAGDGSAFFKPGGSFDNQAGNAGRFFETLDYLGLTGRERVLEIGASFGWASWRFAQKGCEVVAVDISNYLVTADLYFEKDGCYFHRMMADMSVLPFKDGTFDLIFSHSAIHHCKELGPLFREFKRVLRPGGRVVALHECAFGIFENKTGHALEEAIRDGFNENAYTLPQWEQAARDGGFPKVRIRFFSFVNDYIERKESRQAPVTFKLRAAYWIRRHAGLNRFINWLSALPRVLLRPKAWMMVAQRGPGI